MDCDAGFALAGEVAAFEIEAPLTDIDAEAISLARLP
jgi:hypothetical protein